MKIASNVYAITSLLLANLIPLLGVWYLGWNISSIMLLYWAESAIIGFFTIKKMRYLDAEGIKTAIKTGKTANGTPEFAFSSITINGKTFNSPQTANQAALGAMFFIPFFLIHYGIFMLVHLVFVLIFFFSLSLDWTGVLIGFLGLCFSHYVSFQTNFINGGEYRRTSVPAEMFKPYPRIIIMHITIIMGAMFILSSGGHVYALVILVGLKMLVDLGSHLFMHMIPKGMVVQAHSSSNGGKRWKAWSGHVEIK